MRRSRAASTWTPSTGSPYVAWSQPNGRTLDALIGRCRAQNRRLPVEHALLIAEKIATALDHAYNTTIDGDRTLHGLVWPGFVALSDDGEIRLAGFGLAAGILPALGKPGIGSLLSRYVAPEERSEGTPGKNSDVYSVGVILLELLTGQKAPGDPLAFVKGVAGAPPPPVVPEILAILRMALAPPESRYRTSGDLRRELGKLLFSGPYSPSTFNLAYFLNELFRNEIEAETRARLLEGGRPEDGGAPPGRAADHASPPAPAGEHRERAAAHPPTPTFAAVRALAQGAARGDLRRRRRGRRRRRRLRRLAAAGRARPDRGGLRARGPPTDADDASRARRDADGFDERDVGSAVP